MASLLLTSSLSFSDKLGVILITFLFESFVPSFSSRGGNGSSRRTTSQTSGEPEEPNESEEGGVNLS